MRWALEPYDRNQNDKDMKLGKESFKKKLRNNTAHTHIYLYVLRIEAEFYGRYDCTF